MRKLIALVALAATLTACTKEACEKQNFGYVDIVNNTNDRWEVYRDGQLLGTVETNSTLYSQKVTAGVHSFSGTNLSTQQTGTWTGVDVITCETYRLTIP